jgi:TonB-dependent starch-binding outer membrane protein SusC
MMRIYLPFLLPLLLLPGLLYGQHSLQGTVRSATDGQPLVGATVVLQGSRGGTHTDGSGQFTLTLPTPRDTLFVSLIGYQTRKVPVALPQSAGLVITLPETSTALKEVVVSTGYQDLPQERSTGSFAHIDKELLNRSTGPSLVQRLEGVTNSLAFDRRALAGERTDNQDRLSLRVRGVSTLFADTNPLVVVDNFPYEGDLANLNPNDVESVTVLKDAAAASIWGARAGNGVLVITTKRGRYEQPTRVSLNTNVQVTARPDLFHDPGFLPAAEFIEIERSLFARKYYLENDRTPISPAVETWIRQRDGQISEAEANALLSQMAQADIRREALAHLYRPEVQQQYALSVNGGSKTHRYYLSAGYDQTRATLIGNQNRRVTLNAQNTFRASDRLEFTAGMAFARHRAEENGLGISALATNGYSTIYPYARLADDGGNPLPLLRGQLRSTYTDKAESQGLLDWKYRPLDEIRRGDNTGAAGETRLSGSVGYRLLEGLRLSASYQYQRQDSRSTTLHAAEGFYARDLVNRFTQANGTRMVPLGGILAEEAGDQVAHTGRAQLDIDRALGSRGRLTALAGAEVRQHLATSFPSTLVYGYNAAVGQGQTLLDYVTFFPNRPATSQRIPAPTGVRNETLDRFVSYYANAAYVLLDRYTLSASTRWDASNLYGVATNQKGVPLWSVGAAWLVSDAPFYSLDWLPSLKLRATYGIAGNTNRSVTAFPTMSYAAADAVSRLPYGILRSAGNPRLRWEKTATLNLGLDFGLRNDRVTGSLEYYRKQGSDLLGDVFLDPTSGILSSPGGFTRNRVNYADVRTRGVDLTLSSRNLTGKLRWQTDLLFSYVDDEVTGYDANATSAVASFLTTAPPPRTGYPIQGIYSYRWHGLSPEAGDPLVPVGGRLGTDYTTFQNSLTPDSLLLHGSAVPTFFGSLRNTLSWGQFSLSANLLWKAGFYFRRGSIRYNTLYANGQAHVDYRGRWQKAGDEQHTQVPSAPLTLNTRREDFYANSEVLVERGDHVRLQDINLSYTFSRLRWPSLPLRDLRLFLYARDLGILWRANRQGLDPEYLNTSYPPSRSLAFGVQANF